MPIWQYCARLGIFGPSGSGKSWKSRLIGKLAYSGEILVEPTKPAFIDLCAEGHTVVLTEADEAFRSPGRAAASWRSPTRVTSPTAARAGSRAAWPSGSRCSATSYWTASTACSSPNRPDLDPLISRTIALISAKAPAGYRPPRFDGQARATAALLGQHCAQWMAQEVQDGLANVVPLVPEHLGNRPFTL